MPPLMSEKCLRVDSYMPSTAPSDRNSTPVSVAGFWTMRQLIGLSYKIEFITDMTAFNRQRAKHTHTHTHTYTHTHTHIQRILFSAALKPFLHPHAVLNTNIGHTAYTSCLTHLCRKTRTRSTYTVAESNTRSDTVLSGKLVTRSHCITDT